MTDESNVFTTFASTPAQDQAIEAGDVALVLKKNGSVQAINFGYDRSRLNLPEVDQTDADKAMIEQGRKLFALALAATHPVLMQLLLDIASDPEIVDFDKLRDAARVH